MWRLSAGEESAAVANAFGAGCAVTWLSGSYPSSQIILVAVPLVYAAL